MPRPLRIALGAIAVLAAAAAALLLLHPRGPARPDVVLVVWDTCRGDRVSVNGYARPTTPRLAEFARGGVTFRRCYAPSPWTPPAHASLFTGLLPRRHGLQEDRGDQVRPGVPLLAETLRAAGYETVCMTANPQISPATGLVEGFETVIPCYGADSPRGEGEKVVKALEDWLARRAVRGGPRRPLFLYLNIMETHLEYTFRREDAAAVLDGEEVEGAIHAAGTVDEIAANQHLYGIRRLPGPLLRDLGLAYDAAVHAADRMTGRILDRLDGAGILGDAFVAVTGDHGENLGEHGQLNHLLSLYDPVLHVPLVVRRPGMFEGGRAEDAQVRLQDLYPTILEAAGVPCPAPCGKDALPLDASPLRPRVLVAEYGPALDHLEDALAPHPDAPPSARLPFHLQMVAVRDPSNRPGARKLLQFRYFERKDSPGPVRWEMYDVATDPGESRDLGGPPAGGEDLAAFERLRAIGEAGR